MTNYKQVIRLLVENEVAFIIVGGVAANIHGSGRLTYDLDLVYNRSKENLIRIADVLKPYKPYLRGAPLGLPFDWSWQTLATGLNFTLNTTLGYIDLLGEIVGGGKYEDLAPHCVSVDLYGHTCLCLGLDALIKAKRAAGRPKDFEDIAILESLAEEQSGYSDPYDTKR